MDEPCDPLPDLIGYFVHGQGGSAVTSDGPESWRELWVILTPAERRILVRLAVPVLFPVAIVVLMGAWLVFAAVS